MKLTRRQWIASAAALPIAADAMAATPAATAPALPAKADFAPMSVAYLDSGTMHPISLGARAALDTYYKSRALLPSAPHFGLDDTDARVAARFAGLINATPQEVCLTQSTTAGEHLVVKALGIPGRGGRIVTDTLHFPGSFYLYEELARLGMDVVWLKPRDDMRIAIEDIEAAVDKNTKLVALSTVSTINGFEHDLKSVCEIAHAKGAYVYADSIHAVGATPFDVRASNVDFAASASYKWLMGDFGLGFLYIRADLLERFPRSQFGYEQLAEEASHVYPFDPPGKSIIDYAARTDATGHFAMGTTSSTCAVHLDYSLAYIESLGVSNIQAHRQPLLDRARRELVRAGYRPLTPEGSRTSLLSFAHPNPQSLAPRLDRAGVKITLRGHRFRISPSVFNDEADIDRLLEALT